MTRTILLLVLFTGTFFSCKREQKQANNSTDKTMDSVNTAIQQPSRIRGPEGFLYIDDKGGTGIPVVFMHSFCGNTEHWKYQLEHLRPDRRAIAFDFRGHGKSDAPNQDNYAAEALAQDLAATVENLKLSRFVLVGHSMGGSAAIAYADAHPEQIAGLVLVGTPGKTTPQQANQIISALEADYNKVMDDYMNQLLEGARAETDSIVRADAKKISKSSSLAIIKALFQFNPLPAMTRYTGPVLIVATPREEEQPTALLHLVPEVPHQIIKGTSHWIQLDKPETFNKILDDFLEKQVNNK
jgi:pimeloyl-ACP methyl ester carboxylesterase